MPEKTERDVEKACSVKQTVAKLRRPANCLEPNQPFTIQVTGERIRVPTGAVFNVEHEPEGRTEKLEFQFKCEN
ncbi:hypothetical protein DSCA_61710 [Desulfosarcina alkanivorans]|uniref:Amphi-Trp domain-containing protein n=1 Tax=Desulfosarcina alkanivorans TaxID=571177 RepID=A0A5K7YYL4_9BACT|nr:amphi-Trp domain-containing protein [Desulfosarcina alkanivorans]BBO72241.1 hypothetical protein DSCA_61710 [Desulfosarcina alkanivorans]